jgi:peroxiredoxin
MFIAFVERDVCKAKKYEDSIKFIPKCNFILCMGVEMGKEKLQQTLFSSLFKTITRA